jgi:hypothetical protein
MDEEQNKDKRLVSHQLDKSVSHQERKVLSLKRAITTPKEQNNNLFLNHSLFNTIELMLK